MEVSIYLSRIFNTKPSPLFLQPKRELVPYTAFISFRNDYQEPTLNEGFSEIKKVHWVFQGTEEENRYWSMWLQIDGK
jgi:bifunctional polynucleotide phosphatase/kinase